MAVIPATTGIYYPLIDVLFSDLPQITAQSVKSIRVYRNGKSISKTPGKTSALTGFKVGEPVIISARKAIDLPVGIAPFSGYGPKNYKAIDSDPFNPYKPNELVLIGGDYTRNITGSTPGQNGTLIILKGIFTSAQINLIGNTDAVSLTDTTVLLNWINDNGVIRWTSPKT